MVAIKAHMPKIILDCLISYWHSAGKYIFMFLLHDNIRAYSWPCFCYIVCIKCGQWKFSWNKMIVPYRSALKPHTQISTHAES